MRPLTDGRVLSPGRAHSPRPVRWPRRETGPGAQPSGNDQAVTVNCTHQPPCNDLAEHRKQQRADWKRALAQHNKNIRNRRTRRKPPGYQPGMNTITSRRSTDDN